MNAIDKIRSALGVMSDYGTSPELRSRADEAITALTALATERDELQQLLTDGASLNIALINERDELRARLAAIDAAPTVAWLSTDCIGERYLCFSCPDDQDPVIELIARPEAK